MAQYGADDVVIEVDADEDGTLTDVKAHVDTMNGVEITALIEQSNTFGDSWIEQLFSGVSAANPLTLEGFYDDGAGAATPKTMYNNSVGETRSVRLTWGSTNTTAFEALLTAYSRTGSRDGSVRYSVTFTPTGAVTEA